MSSVARGEWLTKDHIGRLPAQLERDVLEITLGGGLHDFTASKRAAGECHLVDAHVGRDGLADGVTVPYQDVDDAWREASLGDERSHAEGSKGSDFGWFDDDRVACREGRCDFPREHQHWDGVCL